MAFIDNVASMSSHSRGTRELFLTTCIKTLISESSQLPLGPPLTAITGKLYFNVQFWRA